jgi:hypothetical protein
MSLTIRKKILGSLLLVALLFTTILLYVQFGLNRIADQEITINLRSGKLAYERYSELRNNLLISQARALAQTPHLKAVLTIPDVDQETINYSVQTLYEASEIPFMLLADVEGNLLADPHDPSGFNDDVRSHAGITEGMTEGLEYTGVWIYKDLLYQIALTPVTAAGSLIGLLVVGIALDAKFASEVREVTGRDVLIFQDGHVVSEAFNNENCDGTSPGLHISRAEQENLRSHLTAAQRSTLPFRVILRGNDCLAVSVPLPDQAGEMILFRAIKEVESEVGALRTFVLIAGGISCILAIVFSIWLSVRVTKPLQQITDNARSITSGARDRKALLTEVDGLIKNISHIKEIVAMHQNYAKTTGVTEILLVHKVLDESISMLESSSLRHSIKVERYYEQLPRVLLDKHKLQTILINLLTNAHEALKEIDHPEKRIEVRLSLSGEKRVLIAIQDNGCGIQKENITRIFSHGFTTRESGHGFGLHSAALAANDLQGNLHATSDGLNTGATLILDLPYCIEHQRENDQSSHSVESV